MNGIASVIVTVAIVAIGTIIGAYIKDMIDFRIMNHRMKINSRYLRNQRERNELDKRRRHRDGA